MQKRFRNYQHAILSFEHNVQNFGLHSSGRYRGFDTFNKLGGLSFSIGHAQTGQRYKDTQNVIQGPLGVFLTKQGVIVQETETLVGLSLETNAGNASVRKDLLVATHQFTNLSGGADVVYEIIKGPLGSSAIPGLVDTYKQTRIGFFEIPANATDLTSVLYYRDRPPDSGDSVDAALGYVNRFERLQCIRKDPTSFTSETTVITTPTAGNLWNLGQSGNIFQLLPTTAKSVDGIMLAEGGNNYEGTVIWLRINENVHIRSPYGATLPGSFASSDYKPFKIDDSFFSGSALGGFSAIKPGAGQIWFVKCMYINAQWEIMAIEGKQSNNGVPSGLMAPWKGLITGNFDETGLGINAMKGWALCNGNNGTPDRRRKFSVCTDASAFGGVVLTPSLYYNYAINATGGDEMIELLINHLAPHTHFTAHSTDVDDDQFPSERGATLDSNKSITRSWKKGSSGVEGYILNGTSTAPNIGKSSSTGSGDGHRNLPPFIADIWIMKL